MSKMECHVIEDLLPSYVDDICSPETTQEVEDHLQGCEMCRARLEQMKQYNEGAEAGEPVGIQDIRPFRKISRKMKHNRTVKVVAIALLIVVCGVFGVLTVSQLFPDLDCPNYDSILCRFRAKEIARKLVSGDEDQIREVLVGIGTDYGSKLLDSERNYLINDVAGHLAENQTSFANATIHVDEVSYCVEEYYVDEEEGPQPFGTKYAYYRVGLTIQCAGGEMYMDIGFHNRNQYVVHMRTGEYSQDIVKEGMDENSLEYQVIDINKYLDYYLSSCFLQRFETHLLNARISNQNAEALNLRNQDEETTEAYDPFDTGFYTYYLTEDCMKPGVEKEGVYCTEYSQQTGGRLYQILLGCQSNRFQMTEQDYNKTEKKFDATLYWEITDLNGKKCIMTKAFYLGPSGYEPADDTETICADDGFDDNLLQKMERLFD